MVRRRSKPIPTVTTCVLCNAMIVAVGRQGFDLPDAGAPPSALHTCAFRPYADRTPRVAIATLQALAAGEDWGAVR